MSYEEGGARRIGWLLLGRSVSVLADQLLLFVVPLAVYRSTASVAWAGIAFTVEWIPRILALLCSGSLVGRTGAKAAALWADALRSAACLAAAIAVGLLHVQPVAVLVALAAISGFLFEQGYVATEILVAKAPEPTMLARAQARLQAIEQCAQIAGPALASLLYAGAGLTSLLAAAAALFALASAAERRVGAVPAAEPAARSMAATITAGFREVLGAPAVLRLIGWTMAANLLFGLALVSAAAITTGTFGKSSAHYSLLASAGAIASLAAAVVPRRVPARADTRRRGAVAFALLVLGAFMIGVAPSYGVYLAGYVLVMGADTLFSLHIRAERVRLLPGVGFDRAVGIIVLCNFLPMPLAGLLFARLGAVWGSQWPLGAAAAFALAAVLLLRPRSRDSSAVTARST